MGAWSQPCGHVLHPGFSCTGVAAHRFAKTFFTVARFYGAVHVFAAALRGKLFSARFLLHHLLPAITRSATFGAVTGVAGGAFMCFFARTTGHRHATYLLSGILAGLSGIYIEDPRRRRELAVFVSSQAGFALRQMLAHRGYLPPVGDIDAVIAFSIALAVLNALYFDQASHKLVEGGEGTFMDLFVGRESWMASASKEEQAGHIATADPAPTTSDCSSDVPSDSSDHVSDSNSLSSDSREIPPPEDAQPAISSPDRVEKIVRSVLAACRLISRKEASEECEHAVEWHALSETCGTHALVGGVKAFLLAWAARSLLAAAPKIARGGGLLALTEVVAATETTRFACALGSMSMINRALRCVIQHHRNKDDRMGRAIAGGVAGLAATISPSLDLSMYLVSKALAGVVEGGASEMLSSWWWGDNSHGAPTVFAVATGVLLWSALFEPHALRPSVWTFYVRQSGGTFGEMFTASQALRDAVPMPGRKDYDEWYRTVARKALALSA